jgi:predicted metal-dependent HD superfamily phosphohydrolase
MISASPILDYQLLKAQIEDHVRGLFMSYQRPALVYHNLHHTESVVIRAMEIARVEGLSTDDEFLLFTAAWFHDTGHLFTEPRHHEEASLQIANTYLDSIPGITPLMFAHIERCILATKMPQVPCTAIEQILCDADTYHFGTQDFFVINELVKEEARLRGIDVRKWNEKTLELMRVHTFHTGFGKEVLGKGKAQNMLELHELITQVPE